MPLTLAIDPPADLARFRLPAAVDARLWSLLDRQDAGQPLTPDERAEVEGLVNLADLLSLLRLRAERLPASRPEGPMPADEWERRLFAAAVDCGVSVPDHTLSSDGLYD